MTDDRVGPAGDESFDVAIVGMAGRFPGAGDVTELWDHICAGVRSIRPVSVPADAAPGYVGVWAGIEGADCFDASFFGIAPREASLIDPQQRTFLECAWHVLEDAGVDPAREPGDIGVFGASGINLYLLEHLMPNDMIVQAAGRFSLAVANDKDNTASRVSYKLGLTGPSVTFQANCSSSSVAAHFAAVSLLEHECDLAVVGGSSIKAPRLQGYVHDAGTTTSRTGDCRPFDAEADGYVIGDAVAAIVLRRLDDARRNGDRIYAVIKGSAANNDGSEKVSFVSPGRAGQRRVIQRALAAADVAASSLQYVETNGTATPMGDAIELSAIREAFGDQPPESGSWRLSSIKGNVGNLDAAAGVTAIIKTAMALYHGVVPPTAGHRTAHPQLHLDDGPFEIPTVARPWPLVDGPRRASINSFGVGGTNVSFVLEGPPPRPAPAPVDVRRPPIMAVSARTDGALEEMVERYCSAIIAVPPDGMRDMAYTSQVGRKALERRAVGVGWAPESLAAELRNVADGNAATLTTRLGLVYGDRCDVGSATLEMIVATEPVIATAIEVAAAAIERAGGPRVAISTWDEVDHRISGPLLQCAVGRWWQALVGPAEAVLGIGRGQIAAAVSAGVVTFDRAMEHIASTGPVAIEVAAAEPEHRFGPSLYLSSDDRDDGPIDDFLDHGVEVVVDGGDGRALQRLRASSAVGDRALLASIGATGDDGIGLATALAWAWRRGLDVDWVRYQEGTGAATARVPDYAFARAVHWIDPPAPIVRTTGDTGTTTGVQANASGVSITDREPEAAPAGQATPRGPLERLLASLWSAQLGLANVSRDRSFLDLGGDSLMAGQILADLGEIIPTSFDLTMFLDAPTIAEQAELLRHMIAGLVDSIRAAEEVLEMLGEAPDRMAP